MSTMNTVRGTSYSRSKRDIIIVMTIVMIINIIIIIIKSSSVS